MSSTDLLEKLIVDFFKSGKEFDGIIKPPTKSIEQKVNYIIDEATSIYSKVITDQQNLSIFYFDANEIKQRLFEYQFDTPEMKFLTKYDRGIFIVKMIAEECGLRNINNIISSFYRRIDYFGDTICWIDLLVFSFIEIKYPELINLFEKNIDYFNDESIVEVEQLFDQNKEQQKTEDRIVEIIEKYIPNSNDKNKSIYLKLIGLAANFYFYKFKSSDGNDKINALNEHSTSSYGNFKRYFLKNKDIKDFDSNTFNIYQSLLDGENEYEMISNKEIYNLSQFVRNNSHLNTNPEFFLLLGKEIFSRFESKKIQFHFDYENFNSMRTKLSYELCYLLLWYLESVENKNSVNKAINLYIKYILSTQVPYSSKFIAISAFANHQKPGRGNVDYKFERIWLEKMYKQNKEGLVKAIRNVFEKFNQDFINGDGALYSDDEQYTYTMYQYWSGNSKSNEVEKIRRLALRGINKSIIENYWRYYPSVEELTSKDMLSGIKYTQTGTLNLYMPLINLISVTIETKGLKKEIRHKATTWKNNIDKIKTSGKYSYLFNLKDASDTLRHSLIISGILRD